MTDDGFGALMVCAVTQIRLGGGIPLEGVGEPRTGIIYMYICTYIYSLRQFAVASIHYRPYSAECESARNQT